MTIEATASTAAAFTTPQTTRIAPSGAATAARRVHRVLNHLILIAVPLQFYAAGLAVFGASSFAMHSMLGQAMVPLALLSLIASFLSRSAGASPWRAAVLLFLMVLQPILAFAPRASFPAISAVHPVVGLAIAVLAWQIDRRLCSR
jgi:hypothetical protein